MQIETPTNNRVQLELPAVPQSKDEELRNVALRHVEHVHKLKLYVFAYVLAMIVLTPVWIITQYESSPGWLEHLSSRSRYPGDWDPWLIWVGLAGAVVVAIAAYRVYTDRTETPDEVEREVERLRLRR